MLEAHHVLVLVMLDVHWCTSFSVCLPSLPWQLAMSTGMLICT